jgi:iron complex transport system ATP-binding protein
VTLAARDLSVALGGRAVLESITFDSSPGELIAVLGPNGAGKSTLLRCLAGLHRPLTGTVTLSGRDLADWERRALARAVAYLPQSRAVHWPLAVRSAVALGRLPHGGSVQALAGAHAEAVERALSAMELTKLAHRPVTELSGGELARTLIARALAQEASVLLADEPSAGLDPAHQLGLFEGLRRLAAEGRIIFVALHDLSLAARFCDRVLLLKAGRIIGLGAPATVLTEEALARAYEIRARLIHIEGNPFVLPSSRLS